MSKSQLTNGVVLIAVVGTVAAAAWFKSTQPESANTNGAADAIQRPRADAGENATTQPVAAKLPRLVDLGADKCIPCKKLAPILKELRKEYEGRLRVEVIDVWKDPAAGTPYNIRLIPTQILYDPDGKELWRHEGFISKKELKALFAEKAGVK